MAIAVTIEAAIRRPAEEVFARVADIDRWPSWLIASGIVTVARASAGPVQLGERMTVEQRAAGRAGTFESEVTVLEPPRRFAISGRDGDGVSIEIEASVQPAETGDRPGAALRWSIRIGLPLRYRMFESMARPQVERAARLDLEALRIGLESARSD